MADAGRLGFPVSRTLVVAFGWSLAAAPSFAAGSMPMAPHRAVYDLSMLKSTGDSAPSNARGRIVFDFNGSACEGYSVSFRQVTEMQSQEGPAIVSDMRSATFEDPDTNMLTFKIETLNNGRSSEVIDGMAVKSGDGALSLDLRSPKPTKIDIDKDVVFPTEQLIRLVEAAKDGKRTVEMNVFDGSDTGQKIYATLTVIGKEATTPPAEKPAQIDGLANVRRWPVVISFFDTAKPSDTPNYILGFDLYENGISGALRLDYGNFVLKGELSSLELRPAKECK